VALAASPRALGGAGICAARIRSRRVMRTLQQNHNESEFYGKTPVADLKEKFKMDFLENLSSDFRKIPQKHAPIEINGTA